MTRAQLRVYNRLGKKQANRLKDVVVVEENEGSVIFYVAFPGLYMTYDNAGGLIETHTRAQWKKAQATPAPRQLVFKGGLAPPIDIDDDDVPF